jgi:Na+/H+ antiporter NhaD/arsenite permease-like protein
MLSRLSLATTLTRKVELGIAFLLFGYGLLWWKDAIPLSHGHSTPEGAVAHAWAVLPFCGLLLAIAVFPLWNLTKHHWERNSTKLALAVLLAAITLAYLAFGHPAGSITHAAGILKHTLLADYVPFIVLLFTLYTICGGIRIAGDLPAHSLVNLVFLGVGAVLASFIGTTGAAMLLIRPLLETNRERKNVAHTIVFFILIVCNCGGLLLPLGDPPLFLGYLQGVPFFWTLQLWKSWLLVNGLLLAVYYVWDRQIAYPRESAENLRRDESRTHRLHFGGLLPNVPLLLAVVACAALLDPSKTLPLTDIAVSPYMREAALLLLVLLSLVVTPLSLRAHNNFQYGAIVEVACLFLGIFVCMQPALEILGRRGAELGLTSPASFFWASGSLSSVLDNAPTYLVFFQAAQSLTKQTLIDQPQVAQVAVPFLQAVSLGSVMMGAMTYIGNGPNFMVKTIAEESKVKMPSFFGYMLYSFGVLLPILLLRGWLLG